MEKSLYKIIAEEISLVSALGIQHGKKLSEEVDEKIIKELSDQTNKDRIEIVNRLYQEIKKRIESIL